MKPSRRIGVFASVPVFLGLEAIKRILRVLYAALASDVLYSASPLPEVLFWVSVTLEMLALALAVGTITVAVKDGARKGAALLGLFVGVLLLDGIIAFLIDLWQHNIAGIEAYAALNLLLQTAEPAAVLLGGFILAVLFGRTGKTDAGRCMLSVGTVSALYTATRLAVVLTDVIAFFRVYRYPTAAEITAMITDAVSVLLLCGVVFFGASFLTVRIWLRRKETDTL